MNTLNSTELLNNLSKAVRGIIKSDNTHKIIYSTDASAYSETPLAVVFPEDTDDLISVVKFAYSNGIPLIPRAAGTSLAGQVVGNGIVVDISRNLTATLEINVEQSWVIVEPGVILDELNQMLEPHGLFFGPETSTANRCMIGGMIGNNSCGSHSLIYGSTRDHLLEAKVILADGSSAHFKPLSKDEFSDKLALQNLEGDIYRHINSLLSIEENIKEIEREFPEAAVKRRNTGYALDLLADTSIFGKSDKPFNLCSLLAGSEGTLGFVMEAKLNLVPLPPKEKAVVCIHLNTLEEAFYANLTALQHSPTAVELMDKNILDLTKGNLEQSRNRFFVEGEPAAILIVELVADDRKVIEERYQAIVDAMKQNGYGYHYPIVWGAETAKVWNLRKAGLGVLSNMKGDAKPVSVIEDTAVAPERLPAYMQDLKVTLDRYKLSCVYHAHIGTGELHLRPILNLKDKGDVALFRQIATDIAALVKKHKGSLSGEHGDGRLRGEFIPLMVGEKCYDFMKKLKATFDKKNILNPNKIVETPPMNSSLRYTAPVADASAKTVFNYDDSEGFLRAVERCNGSGDCRKTILTGGVMCPSYMATKDEDKTTRARANMLRHYLVNSPAPFNSKEVYDILDLCLSCKGCNSECPSNIDMAKLKAEFLQHYYDRNGIPLRSRLIANITYIYRLGSVAPTIFNWVMSNQMLSKSLQETLGFSKERALPLLYKKTLRSWFKNHSSAQNCSQKQVYLFADEFTNFNDVEIGMKAILLLEKLGYSVVIPNHSESGRTYISKGLIRRAQKLANRNIEQLSGIIDETTPLIGIEPSAILSFRDEYPDLAYPQNRDKAKTLAKNTMLIDEFLMREMQSGKIKASSFTSSKMDIHFHGHCQQKAIATTNATKFMLGFPENYSVQELKTGCCGMAGSFGYEKEHYSLSMKIGELALFPSIRSLPNGKVVAAPGTSCRHHIKDGTGEKALHPIEIMYNALNC